MFRQCQTLKLTFSLLFAFLILPNILTFGIQISPTQGIQSRISDKCLSIKSRLDHWAPLNQIGNCSDMATLIVVQLQSTSIQTLICWLQVDKNYIGALVCMLSEHYSHKCIPLLALSHWSRRHCWLLLFPVCDCLHFALLPVCSILLSSQGLFSGLISLSSSSWTI